MSYGPVVHAENGSTYTVAFKVAASSDVLLARIEMASMTDPSSTTVKDAIQTLIDLLDNSPTFENVSGGRQYSAGQEITPTP